MGFKIRATSAALGLAMSTGLLAAAAGTAQAQVGASQIQEGDSGFGVYCVQVATNWWLDAPTQIDEDGSFGPATKAQVVWFQEQNHLAQDGVVGPDTGSILWVAIQQDIQAHNSNWNTPWGVPIGNCYQVLPTHT